MSYLGYKNIAYRKHMREQRRVAEWKAEQKAKRKKFREWCTISTTVILQLVVVALIIVFYGLFASAIMAKDTIKVGEGPFVMAVSYTQSYDDLEYVANFMTCDEAEKYFYKNCTSAPIMMCQLEDKLYMPVSHETRNTFSKFDFEVDDSQSCGFVKTQKGYNTFIEE